VSIVDGLVVLLAVFAGFRGYRQGLVGQVFEFGGGFLGLVGGIALGPAIAGGFTRRAGLQGALISLLVVFVAMAIGQTLGFVIGHKIGHRVQRANLGHVNSGAGVVVSVLVTFMSFWLLGSLLIQGPSRPVARALNESQILHQMNQTLPDPPNVLGYIQQYLNTSGFPQVFATLPRDSGPPVKMPTKRTARRAGRAAAASTVRITTPACGGLQLGSGWVVAEGTVVTNAHVVAGGDDITVRDRNGDHPGIVVLFDKNTDVAIVKADGLAGPPLPLETDRLDAGVQGATVGYPGDKDGQLVAKRAAIQAYFDAVGRDIYGRRKVTRSVYEVRARVRQGDSGGPFVLPDGRVGGVVFAASTTDTDTGYVLTGAEVEDEITDGIASDSATGTGSCTR
jgi:S1-C subfamily serine protease